MRNLALTVAAAAMLAPAARADASMGVLATEITYASDYRFDGLSSSDNEPVLQGYAYWWRPDNWFAGVFASEIDRYVQGRASDGFVLVPHLTPSGLDEFVDRVVPLLQERGVFRTEYPTDGGAGATLRGTLGLPDPHAPVVVEAQEHEEEAA